MIAVLAVVESGAVGLRRRVVVPGGEGAVSVRAEDSSTLAVAL